MARHNEHFLMRACVFNEGKGKAGSLPGSKIEATPGPIQETPHT